MCLSSKWDLDRVKAIPKDDEFYVYKRVNYSLAGQELRSPVYTHYKWKPGDQVADLTPKGNGDAGFYVMLIEMPPEGIGNREGAGRVIRLRVKREHILAGGPDYFVGHASVCLVVSHAHLSQEAYDVAMSNDTNLKYLEVAKEKVVEAKKSVKSKKAETAETVKKAKKATKKATKAEKPKKAKKLNKEQTTAMRAMKLLSFLNGSTIDKIMSLGKAAGAEGMKKKMAKADLVALAAEAIVVSGNWPKEVDA